MNEIRTGMINIKNIEKKKVLAALYNNAKPQGLGILHYDSKPISEEEAEQILNESKDKYFDYLKGRVMKVDLSKDVLDPCLYDRDNGPGAAQKAIDTIN